MGRSKLNNLDETGCRLLEELQKNSRISYRELGDKVGLSCSSVIERIKRLEEDNLIKNYTIVLDPNILGFAISAIIEVKSLSYNDEKLLSQKLLNHPCVLRFWIVTGDYDFVIETIFPSIQDMNAFLVTLAEHGQTQSFIVIDKSPVKPISKETLLKRSE